MKCHKCSYEFQPFETACPRCARLKKSTGTQKLNTQHLVHLDQCPHCKWLLFPTDKVCTSCGKSVGGAPAHLNGSSKAQPKVPSVNAVKSPGYSLKFSKQRMLDLGMCLIVFGSLAVLIYMVYRGAQAAS